MAIKIQEYKDFSLRLHDKGARKPIMGQLELTHRCNLRCQHCYIAPTEQPWISAPRQARGHLSISQEQRQMTDNQCQSVKISANQCIKRELSTKEVYRILDEIYKEGCLWLCLTGGEPLLREDFLDIYSYAYKKGFILTIFTNATFLNDRIAKYFKKFPPFYIEVTFNGITKNTYELITQTPDSFKKAIAGIELIRKHKLPLRLKCQMMTLNIDEIPQLFKFYNSLGLEFYSSILIEPRIDGSTEPCSLRLPIKKILELRKHNEMIKDENEVCDRSLFPSQKLFRCPGGTWAFYVNPFGELFFCNSMRKPSWDLRKHSFRQGFYEFFRKIRCLEFKTDSPCRTCQLRQICHWCPARAYLETGDRESPIPYYCELAKSEAQDFEMAIDKREVPYTVQESG